MEHRCSPRLTTDLKVRLRHQKLQRSGRLLNCSTLGFYISTDGHQYALHKRVAVDVALRDIDGNAYTFVFEGRVVRKDEAYIALELEAARVPTQSALSFIDILKQLQAPRAEQRQLG